MNELENCYGDDGTYVCVTYPIPSGKRMRIPEYTSYKAARFRCTNPRYDHFASYQKLGVEFKFDTFQQWWDALGRKPTAQHTVDRINNNGNYEAGNVRWATKLEQSINRSNVIPMRVTYPDGRCADFATAEEAATCVSICAESVLRLCKGTREVVKGYRAEYIHNLKG